MELEEWRTTFIPKGEDGEDVEGVERSEIEP